MAEEQQQVRICVVGDELVAGLGDARALGWVGRVTARTRTEEPVFVATLAVPRESTTALAGRWLTEARRRFTSHTDNRLVLGLGSADLDERVSLARSRLNLANILDSATAAGCRCFVVGPPPRQDVDEAALAALSEAFADVCQRRHVPYVETFQPLRTHEQWLADVAASDGVHPGQAGYGLLAWLVLHHGWHDWLGVAAG